MADLGRDCYYEYESSAPGRPIASWREEMVTNEDHANLLKQIETQSKYTPIAKLQTASIESFYGRILKCKPPFKTRGKDYCLAMVVIDESVPRDSLGLAVSVNIFKRDPDKLPKISGFGDICLFLNFRIQEYNDIKQAIETTFSKCVVFRRIDGAVGPSAWQFEPQISLDNVELETVERIWRATSLSSYGHYASDEQPSISSPSTSATLLSSPTAQSQFGIIRRLTSAELKPSTGIFDYVGRVVDVHYYKATRVLLTDYTENRYLVGDEEAPDGLRNRILSVSFWDEFSAIAANLRKGDIVFCSKLKAKFIDDKLTAAMHGERVCDNPEGRIKVLQEDEPLAIEIRKRDSQFRMQETTAHQANPTLMTDIRRPNIPLYLISDVRGDHAEVGVYCVNAHIIDCGKELVKSGVFRFQMTLRDSSGTLPVIVYGEDGQTFMACYPDTIDQKNREALEKLKGSVLPNQFLIKSYYVKNERRFRIFDTAIVL